MSAPCCGCGGLVARPPEPMPCIRPWFGTSDQGALILAAYTWALIHPPAGGITFVWDLGYASARPTEMLTVRPLVGSIVSPSSLARGYLEDGRHPVTVRPLRNPFCTPARRVPHAPLGSHGPAPFLHQLHSRGHLPLTIARS